MFFFHYFTAIITPLNFKIDYSQYYLMIIELIVFLVAAAALIKSSEWIVKHSTHLSHLLGISTFAVGFIIISIATSLPELAVAIFSVLNNTPGLSVGGIMGSNVTDLTLILGIVAIVGGPLLLKKKELMNLVELLFFTSLITVLIFFQFSQLTFFHGIILLGLFGYLLINLFNQGKISREAPKDIKEKTPIAFAKLGGSIALLLIAAHFMVESATVIAFEAGVSQSLIGVTLIALSTSLPELAIELRAVKSKQYALALGDLFGSAVTNITLVLGTLAILNPGSTPIDMKPVIGVFPIFFITLFFIWYSLSRKEKISRTTGVILVGLYALFLIQELNLVSFLTG